MAVQEPPQRPLGEIVRHFAEKEVEYAGAHSLYEYRLTIRIQEFDESDNVIGEFEQEGEVGFDPRGRRVLRLASNPRSDLIHLGVQRLDLDNLARIPLFILRPEEIPDYEITYVTSERVDEVNTHLFRLAPKGVPRAPQQFFEGVVWVDANQLDIVRAHGRLLPPYEDPPLGPYFQRVEIYREPVDDYLFTTYVRSDDVIRAVGGGTVRARLVIRFTDHKRVREPAPPPPAG